MKYAELLACKKVAAKPELSYSQMLRLLAFYSQIPEQPDFATRLQCYENIPAQAAQLLGRLEQSAPPQLIASFEQAVERCYQNEPLSYILGLSDFSEYTFATGPGVLIPREESEVLLEEAFLFCRNRLKSAKFQKKQNSSLEILELCCGTGCIAISLHQKLGRLVEESTKTENRPQIAIWAADISAAALHYASENAAYWLGEAVYKSKIISKYRFYKEISFYICQSDLFAQKKLQRRYDLILANPPYLSSAECEKRKGWYEPQLALNGGSDGLTISRHIARQAGQFLKPDGAILLEAAPWQMHSLQLQFENSGYRQISRTLDTAGLERVIFALDKKVC